METHDPVVDHQIVGADDQVEELVEDVNDDAQRRLWLRAASGSVDTLAKMDTTIMDGRVQHAVDMAIIAACERIGRLCRSDMGD